MILVDTSVWANHFRRADSRLSKLLENALVLMHPWVVGELALGNLRDWQASVDALRQLPSPPVATSGELLRFIADESLQGAGIGWVDCQLLASVRLATGARLWTQDKRLAALAEAQGYGWPNPG